MVLSADKGVALVIIDKDMYIEKCMALPNDERIYCKCKDKTKSIHSKVVKQLLDLKNPLDQNSRISTSNFTPQMTTALLQDSIAYQKFIKPTTLHIYGISMWHIT